MADVSGDAYRQSLMSPTLLFIVFGIVLATSALLLRTSGAGSHLFGRWALRGGAKPDLAEAPSEWIENHDFWELGEIEEVAF